VRVFTFVSRSGADRLRENYMNADAALWIAGRLAGGALGVFTGFFKTR